ncbi:MAG: hypothetical protein ACTHOE_07700 [Conexibacter sp.]
MRTPTARPAAAGLGAPAVTAWALLAAGLLLVLHAWQGDAYWEYSDGVYALTGRLVLHGAALYRDVAGAQPPPVYYAGAGALGLFGDSVDGLRWGLSLVALATSLLVLVCTWRLTASRPAAVLAGVLALVTPWALREHAQLVPETFAAPLLLGAALAASRDDAPLATLAGVLAAVAVAFKLAFVLPAVAVLLAARRRSRALLAALVAGGVLAGALLLAFGGPLLDGAVRAQRETGTAALQYVGGLWAQAGWNLLPLLACAALAWPARGAVADRALLRTLAAAALGALLLLATLFKHGSYLTVVVVIEPPLLCLAAAGVVAALRARPRPSGRLALAGAAAALLTAQVGSLLVSPGDPALFTRPLAASGPGWTMSSSDVDRAVAAARVCPPAAVVSGPPYLAFAAGRRIAGDQPDQFIVQHAAVLARFRDRADRDQSRCP